jgi:hypothetical protein
MVAQSVIWRRTSLSTISSRRPESTTSPRSVTTVPSVNPAGLAASAFRAEDRAHGLLQDEADSPGREQGLERAALEESDGIALAPRSTTCWRSGTFVENSAPG